MVVFEFVLLGLVLAFFGLGAAYNAREISRKEEQYDAIGSQRDPLDAQPADWKVSLKRTLWGAVGVAGVALVVLGFVW